MKFNQKQFLTLLTTMVAVQSNFQSLQQRLEKFAVKPKRS